MGNGSKEEKSQKLCLMALECKDWGPSAFAFKMAWLLNVQELGEETGTLSGRLVNKLTGLSESFKSTNCTSYRHKFLVC